MFWLWVPPSEPMREPSRDASSERSSSPISDASSFCAANASCGGFAFTDHEKTEVSALEAVKLEDLDGDKIKAEYSKVASAEDDESKLVAETTKAMAAAIGVTL